MSFPRELSVGNKILDSEHKKLHGIITGMARSVAARDVAALFDAFELLENCLCAYFSVEEDIAHAVGLDFTQHRLAHQKMLDEFRRIKDELMDKNGVWSNFEEKRYIDSLRHHLHRHIREDGKPLKIVLDTHLYDFAPG